MSKTHKVTLKPSGQVVEINEGENLLKALREHDCYIKSSCGGHATCSDCIVKVIGGVENLSQPPFEELQLLGNVFHITKERLACQTTIVGDVTIDVSRHDKEEDEERMKNKASSFTKKKLQTKVRKESEVKKVQEEKAREQAEFESTQKSTTENWQKHWEKAPAAEGTVKRLQGGKRPKFFNTDKVDYENEQYTRPLSKEKAALKEQAQKESLKEKFNKQKEFLEENESKYKSGVIEKSDQSFKKFR